MNVYFPPAMIAATTAASLALASPSAIAEPATYVLDEEHFSMVFEIMHIGYAPVMGMFRDVEGQFQYDEEAKELTSGKLTFKSKSVFTNHDKRDDHLRNEDFLDSGKFPDITFEVTGFETTGDNSGIVTGDLTLLGQTRPVDVDVTLNKSAEYPIGHEEYTLGVTAETTLKRSDWGMTYGIENNLVGDEVRMRFGLEAIRESGWF
ncbi:YceI family protein [Marinobacter orientalis]|uniref:YceI family protein n=1 Tax=Marinobacter orientalis TaxID=1928859 RepID=A0A7Y0WSJ0_9GAMM|nr:YceI family protein [Marinobacter orientalis]NMT63836.1 YceI family protein [Marinobacter orientalis]TGX49938.1 polyisoprenoid-binding protein [Marinobacter orientalis]